MSSVSLRTETNNYYRKCPPIVVCYVQQEDDTAAPLSLLKYIQRKHRPRALFHKQIVNLMQFPQWEVLRCHCTGLLSSWFKLNRMFILSEGRLKVVCRMNWEIWKANKNNSKAIVEAYAWGSPLLTRHSTCLLKDDRHQITWQEDNLFPVLKNSPSLLLRVWFNAFQIFHSMNCTYFLAASTFWHGRQISALSLLEMPNHSAMATGAVAGSFQGCHPHKFF